MPTHRLMCAPGTFSPEQKQALADAITAYYLSQVNFGKFYVVVMFLPVDGEDMFIGGKSNVDKKFVRIYVDHLARTLPFNIQTVRFLEGYHKVLAPFISDRGIDYELVVEEGDANLWRENGLVPPIPNSKAEKEWARVNKPVPYTDEDNRE